MALPNFEGPAISITTQARRNEINIGGLKRGASEARKNGGLGACPLKNFS